MRKRYTKPRSVRLAELDQKVEDYLKESGIKFSDLVKKSLAVYLEGAGKEQNTDEFLRELKKIRADLGRVGGNLNQIAFAFNTTGIVYEEDLKKNHKGLQAKFKELSGYFKKLESDLRRY